MRLSSFPEQLVCISITNLACVTVKLGCREPI
jgi:hypothetical protein